MIGVTVPLLNLTMLLDLEFIEFNHLYLR